MNTVTLVGNLTADLDLRSTGNGTKVVNVRIAHTPRVFDKSSNEWTDGEPLFIGGSVWHKAAENLAASVKKGDRVILTGRLKPNNYEKDGVKRADIEIDIDEVGVSTKFKSVTVGGSAAGQASAPAQQAAPAPAAPAASDEDF